MKWRYFIPIVVSLVISFGCAPQGVAPALTGEETKQIIEVEVVDQTLLYRCQSVWSAGKFSELSENDLKTRFKEKYDVAAREFEFSFEPANHSTVTKCNIYGVTTKGGDRYTADLLWLLTPLGLDFIDNDFEESNHGLFWEGCVNGIPMSIEVKCPPQDCVYEAWQSPVGHCHGHIWWPVSSQ